MPEFNDTGEMPLTQPHHAPIFDTGPHPNPLPHAAVAIDDYPDSDPFAGLGDDPPPMSADPQAISGPLPVLAQPVVVPSQFVAVKRWKFVGLTLVIWFAAAAIGLAMYYRWFHAVDKTWPDFVVLVYVVVCMVAALIVSMAEQKPARSALAIGIMSAPFVSGCAAAVLYGGYVFGWVTP
ncbi:MAG: hypothetical protein HYZ38_20745 [Mycobacterium sp.]|nr:hypothetical protein [Mycobacterium sp.]